MQVVLGLAQQLRSAAEGGKGKRHTALSARLPTLFGAILVLIVAGCSDDQIVNRVVGGRDETSTSPELVNEATEFGGVVLPTNSKVLMAHVASALDTMYQLAVQTDPHGLQDILSASKFSDELIRPYPPYDLIVAGPDLATSRSVLRGQDRYTQPDGRIVARVFVVDERDATTRFVHLQLFTN